MTSYHIKVLPHEVIDFPLENLRISEIYRDIIDEDYNTKQCSSRCTRQSYKVTGKVIRATEERIYTSRRRS